MTETRRKAQTRCANYIKETKSSMESLLQELEQLRAESVVMQKRHKEQLQQQKQQHAGEQAQLQEQTAALRKQHVEETTSLRAQMDRDQAVRARQDEELTMLRGLFVPPHHCC